MSKKPLVGVLILGALFSALVFGAEFYNDKERGWFWREEFAEPEPEQPEPPVTPSPSPEAQKKEAEPKPLSAEWMRKNLPVMLDKAVDEPTPENVRAYRYAERYAILKADKYAEASIKATMNDPYLDANSYAPMSAAGEQALAQESSINTRHAMDIISKRVGLWFFFRSDCSFCHRQSLAVNLMREHGMTVKAISLDGKSMRNGLFNDFTPDNGQAAMLGVETVPSLFMIDSKTKNIVYIAQGIVSASELETRIIQQSRDLNIITEETYQKSRFNREPGEDAELTHEDSQNPEKMITAIRSALRKQVVYPAAK